MRIVTLLPSATEIVCALGAAEEIVGISHECEFPRDLPRPPVLTSARIAPLRSSVAIDTAVRDVLKNALAVYDIDVEGLRAARPDVIVTQDLCDVCAVSINDVRAALAQLVRTDVHVVNLHPTRLDDIWADIRGVAEAIGRGGAGERLLGSLNATVDQIARRAGASATRPSVLAIEWIEPVMIAGMWMPELITLAGGRPMVTKPGEHAPTLTREELTALNPDVILITPCGFDVERTLAEVPLLRHVLPWDSWSAAAHGRVFVADGNLYFNRPGPSIVDSLKIMTVCLHREAAPDFTDLNTSVLRVRHDLTTVQVHLPGERSAAPYSPPLIARQVSEVRHDPFR